MYSRITLENGLRIVSEQIPYVRSISIGIWIATGSRNENHENNGVSHFIEHMLFKGTERRTAKEIAESIDFIGGQLNAFTGKECTCFYTKTLDNHADIAIDVLSDMLFHSTFSEKDIETEKRVILEEIGMYEDSPEELVHDILTESIWNGNPLGYPILGTAESLSKIDRDVAKKYMDEYYIPENTVISVVGNFDENEILRQIEQKFRSWKSDSDMNRKKEKPDFIPTSIIREKDTEQVHMCLGFEGVESGNDDLYAMMAVNNILGGGMSSRLFQNIREEKGLVYSIYSYPSSYLDSGLFTIYGGMNPEHLDKVIKLTVGEIKLLQDKGISADELNKAKEQLKGSYILGLESTSGRMNSIGKSELLLGYINTPEEILQKIDEITPEHVDKIIRNIFDLERISFSAVGNIKSTYDFRKALE